LTAFGFAGTERGRATTLRAGPAVGALAADFIGVLDFGLTSGRFFSAMILYRINKNVIAARSKKLVI
jgi:hypothetical protein